MLNIGFISTWHVHTNGYADEVQNSGKAAITAVWDENPAEGKGWAGQRGAAFEADFDAFIRRGDIDAVVCNAPTTMHPLLLTKAAAAGKHIFTEKLLATSVKDCEDIARAVEQAGVVFTLSLPLLADAKIRYAVAVLKAGTLGRVSAARMRRSHGGVSDGWLPPRWFDTGLTGGGALMDLGAHPVYVLAALFGEPRRVAGMLSNLYGTSSDENAIALVEFGGGVLATCETAFTTHGAPDILELYGSEGCLYIHGPSVRLVTKSGEETMHAGQLEGALPSPLAQFMAACLGGEKPAGLGLAEGLRMTRIIEAAYASDKAGTYGVF